jgi:uncharacterized protein
MLALEHLIAIFSTLPVDSGLWTPTTGWRSFRRALTRVFARSRAIIGRMVQNCHPPLSVYVVERIISDFRAGRQMCLNSEAEAAKLYADLNGVLHKPC